MRQDPFANLDKKTFRQAIIELLESVNINYLAAIKYWS